MMQLSIVSVPVSDQERSMVFYRDVLGFLVINEGEIAPGQRWIQMKPPSGPTAISLVNWFPAMAPGSLQGLVLDTGDIDFMHERLAKRGLAIGPVEAAPFGRYAQFSDPDGNGWVLLTLHRG